MGTLVTARVEAYVFELGLLLDLLIPANPHPHTHPPTRMDVGVTRLTSWHPGCSVNVRGPPPLPPTREGEGEGRGEGREGDILEGV